MTDEIHIVLDHTAILAAGLGNPLVSRLIHRAHAEPDWYLYAAACAVVEAGRHRPGTAEHVAALPDIAVVPLDLTGALALAGATTWAHAHTAHAAEPSVDLPDGALVATTDPDAWRGHPVRVLDVRA